MTTKNAAGLPLRALGRTGEMVSALCLGGYHIGKIKNAKDAVRLQQQAIDEGITFLDNAWEYHDGRSETLMGKAIKGRRQEVFLMSKVCTHGRDKREALRQLDDSLRRLQTDYLDLWQVHELAYDNDPERHFAKGGVIEALEAAKRAGKVRFIGFTGHKSPEIHLQMLAYQYPFDACQLPLNCFDGTFRSFEQQVLPELERQGIAALGMKTFGGEAEMLKQKAVAPEAALRYALSLPVATVVTGIENERDLEQNLKVARKFKPFSAAQMQTLRKRCAPLAADGRFELYKVSAKHEGPIGRAQHGFPPPPAMGD